jgi:hypothetical protein
MVILKATYEYGKMGVSVKPKHCIKKRKHAEAASSYDWPLQIPFS